MIYLKAMTYSRELIIYLMKHLIRLFSTQVLSPSIKLNNGLPMPILGLGTVYALNPDEISGAILNNGYRHIDTAKVYDNEVVIGEALQEVMRNGIKREDLFIVTKIPPADTPNTKDEIRRALDRL